MMETFDSKQVDEIAVIGIGCRFPGGITDLTSFWDVICDKTETVTRIPTTRWDWRSMYSKNNKTVAKSFFLNGSFLTQPIDEFEPLFFEMSPKAATQSDPQQRMLLELTWEAMEEGGIVPSRYAGQKIGVFVGVFATDWILMQASTYSTEGNVESNYIATTSPITMLSARLSYFFDFRGPCLTIDTACSSSLTAIHLACQSLRSGESNVAVAGGVNLMLAHGAGSLVAKAGFMSEDGKSKSFDASADGYGRGEGCGIVILKRLQDAIKDGDKIHAVVSGIGINQDGHNEGIVVPSAVAQEALIREVAAQGNVNLKDVAYVEAHGTGTPVGDPLEAQAISNSIGKQRPHDNPVVIGSIKANIGHLEAAAGVAGFIKACLCLKHRAVPPQAALNEPNPYIQFEEMNLRLARDHIIPLKAEGKDLYVGVNSFGYGGSNASAILRAPRAEELQKQITFSEVNLPSDNYILSLSTKQQPSLKLTAERYIEFLKEPNSPSLADICYSVGEHRSFFQRHLVTFGKTKEEIIAKLEDFVQEKRNPDVLLGNQQIKTQKNPVFVFSGMGTQFVGMGKWLLTQGSAEVIRKAKACDQHFKELSGWSILDELNKEESESRIHQTSVSQPAIFVIQVCLFEALFLYGVTPAAVVGHSLGEVAAAYVAGALSLKDAITVVYHRSRLHQTLADRGDTMLAVGMPPSTAVDLIKGYESDVGVAAINSPRSFVLSGKQTTLEKIAEELERRSEFHKFLKVELAYHSPVMLEIKKEFEDAVEHIQPQTAKIPLYSTVTGRICDDTFFHDANYWYRNLRQTVLFAEAITTIIGDGLPLFLEIGPHPALSSPIKECALTTNSSVGLAHTLSRKEPEENLFARTLSALSAAGLELNWDRITGGQRIDLPFYSWAKEAYFALSKRYSRVTRWATHLNPVLGDWDWAASHGWLSELSVNFMPWLEDHKVEGMTVFPASAYVEAALAAHAQIAIAAPKEMQEPAIIESLQLKKPMIAGVRFFPYMTWSFDEYTGKLFAYGRTENDSRNWDLYASASIRRTLPWGGDQIEDIEQLKVKTSDEIDISFFYEKLKEQGLEYGPAFQTVQKLYSGEDVALAHLKIADSEKETIDEYYIHPTLLDGAFQSFGVLCAKANVSSETFIPTAIERVMYYGKHEGELYAYAHNLTYDDEFFIGDIDLYTPQGEPVARIKGLTVKEISSQKQKEAKRAKLLYHYDWQKVEPLSLLGEIARIAVITDNDEISDPFIKELEFQGVTVLKGKIGDKSGKASDDLYHIRANSSDDYADFFSFINLQKCRAVVYLRNEVDREKDTIGVSLVNDLLTFAKSIPVLEHQEETENLRFIVCTHGAEKVFDHDQIVNVEQSSITGFVRVLLMERPDLHLKLIDFDADMLVTNPGVVAAEILIDDQEDDVALRKDDRFILRINPYKKQDAFKPVSWENTDKKYGYRLALGTPGILDSLHYEMFERQKPPAGHVEIEILYAALNFKDLLKIMGILPKSVIVGTFNEDGLGMEVSARVVAVGDDVEQDGYKVGDRLLVTFKNTFTSHAIVAVKDVYSIHIESDAIIREAKRYQLTEANIQDIQKAPIDRLSDIEAAVMPTVFLTAYHTLVNLARLQKGETVLIHAAAGGVGQAAIEIAKMCGARIFATAGSEEKRQLLRDLGCEYVWNSRNLEFVDGVKEVTNGVGVDVVLNSLSGEMLHHSLGVVAPFGRFCEVGKRDIVEGKWLPMAAFNENISFFSMDLDRMCAQRRDLIEDLQYSLVKAIFTGKIKIPACQHIYPAAKIVDAFRLLASAQHMGKIVIDFTDTTDLVVQPIKKEIATISSDGAYLITGAYGGMGLQLAQWLAMQGAKELVLVGRSLKNDDQQIQEVLEVLQKFGVKLHQIQVDIADYAALKVIFDDIAKLNIPLKGVFHCAAVIEDKVIPNLDSGHVSRIMLPKALGAWNLHQLTQNLTLDHFVLFSSATNMLGNPGQAPYVAANSFVDALAVYRKQLGLPALAIEWGAIDSGMLQKDSNIAKNFELLGITPLPVKEALSTIPLLWKADEACLSVIDVNWEKWFGAVSATRSVGRFQQLVALGSSSTGQTEMLHKLNRLPVEERLPFVVQNLIELLTKTLQIPVDSIDGNTRLTELGIDSLVGVELQIAISNALGCEISLLQLMKEENLQDVGKVLLRKLKIQFENNESLVLEDAEETTET